MCLFHILKKDKDCRVLESPRGSKAWLQASGRCWAGLNTNSMKYDAGFVFWPPTSLPVLQWGLDFLMNSTSSRKRILTLLTCFIICCTTLNANTLQLHSHSGKRAEFPLLPFNCWSLDSCKLHTIVLVFELSPQSHIHSWAYKQQKKTLIGHSEGRVRKMMEEDLNRGAEQLHVPLSSPWWKDKTYYIRLRIATVPLQHTARTTNSTLRTEGTQLCRTSGSCSSQAELYRDQTARQGRAITQHALLRRAVSHTVLSLAYLPWHCEL